MKKKKVPVCPECGRELEESWTALGIAYICLDCMALIPVGEERYEIPKTQKDEHR